MRNQLQKALDLASRTGDKIIVVDEFNDRSLMVMSLADYEKLLFDEKANNKRIQSLTEEQLLDKINRDIIAWKDANEERKMMEDFGVSEAVMDDEEDEPDFGQEEDDDSDWVPPSSDSGDLMPEEVEEAENEPTVAVASEESPAKADENENLYYYEEPEAPSVPSKPDNGFTSIKEELDKKGRKAWEIPEEVKKGAEEVKF